MTVLVSVASKHGATQEIAEAVARALTSAGLEAVLVPPDEVRDLDGVDAVVLGSGLYAGHWLKPARELAERLAPLLRGRPVWLLSSGPIGDPPKPDPDAVDVSAVQEQTAALGHQVFAGRLDRSRLGFGEKALVKALKAPEGDFRDWGEIERWAQGIASHLQGSTPATSRP